MVARAGIRKEKHINRKRSVQVWETHRWKEKLGTHLTSVQGVKKGGSQDIVFLVKEKLIGSKPLGKAANFVSRGPMA